MIIKEIGGSVQIIRIWTNQDPDPQQCLKNTDILKVHKKRKNVLSYTKVLYSWASLGTRGSGGGGVGGEGGGAVVVNQKLDETPAILY